jgi:hypothetical protein
VLFQLQKNTLQKQVEDMACWPGHVPSGAVVSNTLEINTDCKPLSSQALVPKLSSVSDKNHTWHFSGQDWNIIYDSCH